MTARILNFPIGTVKGAAECLAEHYERIGRDRDRQPDILNDFITSVWGQPRTGISSGKADE